MNPRRRVRRRRRLYGAALAAHQRRTGRSHRRVRRNPVVAHKARRSRPVRRSRPRPPAMTPAMRRKVSAGVRRYFAQKRASRSLPARMSSAISSYRGRRRSVSRRSGLGGAGIMGGVKGAFTKPLLMKAGGAVLASFGTGMLMQKFGASLPGSATKWGRVGYSVGIPILAAVLLRKRSRDLAEGMMIGGLVMGINAIIQTVKPATTVAAYPNISGYGVAGELGVNETVNHMGWYPNQTTNMGMQVNASPFTNSAWD